VVAAPLLERREVVGVTYYLDKTTDPDAVILRRGDGSEVAASASVSSPKRCNGRRGRTGGGATADDWERR
jgi:hypothetical protein